MIALPLVALDVLVIALWTIAAALAIALIMDKLAAILSGVPAVGGWLAGHVRGMAQAITNACGHLLGGIDHLIGAAWSALSHYLNTMFSQFVAHSALIAHLAEIVAGSLYRVTGLRTIVHRLDKAVHVVLHRFTTIGREIYRLRLRVHKLERDVAQGIGDDLLPRVKTLERELAHAEDVVIPNVRDLAQAAENDVTALAQWVKDHALLVGTSALTGAVAWALSQLGLGGLRCNSLLRSLGNRGCGFWNGLEDLLGLFVDTLLLTNVCTILPWLESAVSEVADPLVVGLTEVGAGLCSGGIGAAPALKVPGLSLPANPGFTLNLP